MAKAAEPKKLSLSEILAKHNLKVVEEYSNYERLSSGSLMLDRSLGGGWVRSGIQEIWGNPSFGKSLLCYISIGRTLATGGTVVLYDMERRLEKDEAWASHYLDVNHPNLKVIVQEAGQTAESLLNSIIDLAVNGGVDQIVMDNKDALVFGAEIEGQVGPKNMGLRSFLLGNFMRILEQSIKDSRCSFLFVSEVRAAFGDTYHPLTTSGGYGVEHKCDIQVQLHTPEIVKVKVGNEESPAKITVKTKTNKNATYMSQQKAEIEVERFTTDSGYVWRMNTPSEVIKIGTELKMFTNKSGESYSGAGNIIYNDRNLGNKNEAIVALLAEPVLLFEIEQAIRSKLGW